MNAELCKFRGKKRFQAKFSLPYLSKITNYMRRERKTPVLVMFIINAPMGKERLTIIFCL
jgi:hypothetical protein